MMKVLSVLVFVLLGVASGMIFQKMYSNTSMLVNILLGIVGSLGFGILAGVCGLGSGIMSFSLWGIVFGIAGAIALPFIYCLIWNRRGKVATK